MLLEDIIPDLISQLKKIEQLATDIPQLVKKKLTQEYLTELINSLINLKDELSHMDTETFINLGIWLQIEQNVIRNFQVPNISDVIRKK